MLKMIEILQDFFPFHKQDYFVPGKVEENGENDEVKRNPLQNLMLKIQVKLALNHIPENENLNENARGKFAFGKMSENREIFSRHK